MYEFSVLYTKLTAFCIYDFYVGHYCMYSETKLRIIY